MSVFRLSVGERAIRVETWPGWLAFDASARPAAGLWADLASAIVPPLPSEWDGEATFELQRIRVGNGHQAEAVELLRQDVRAWGEAGADAAACFGVVHGDDLPAGLLLLRWPSMAVALDGQASFERRGGPRESRERLRRSRGRPVIRGSRRAFRPALVFEPTR